MKKDFCECWIYAGFRLPEIVLGKWVWDLEMMTFAEFGFWACFWERRKDAEMIKKNYKGRCQKRKMKKCKDVVRTYSNIQSAYAEVLERPCI